MDIQTLLEKKYSPKSGGAARLATRLAEERESERREISLWSAAAAAAVIVLAGVSFAPNLGENGDAEIGKILNLGRVPAAGDVRVAGGEASALPAAVDGVRIYWVFR